METEVNIPKISVLLAAYNGEKYIKKSIDSVLLQTFKEIELLIGFNGTIDNSKDVVNAYNDKRIRIFDYGEYKGKSKTLNKLLKESNAKWIAIQDDDDIWVENKLEEQIKFCNEFDIIGTQIKYIDKDDSFTKAEPIFVTNHERILLKMLGGDNHIANTSAIFKKDKAVEVNGWDEEIKGVEDFDFWLKMIKIAKCKAINLDNAFVYHRIHSDSNFNTKIWNVEEIIKKYQ